MTPRCRRRGPRKLFAGRDSRYTQLRVELQRDNVSAVVGQAHSDTGSKSAVGSDRVHSRSRHWPETNIVDLHHRDLQSSQTTVSVSPLPRPDRFHISHLAYMFDLRLAVAPPASDPRTVGVLWTVSGAGPTSSYIGLRPSPLSHRRRLPSTWAGLSITLLVQALSVSGTLGSDRIRPSMSRGTRMHSPSASMMKHQSEPRSCRLPHRPITVSLRTPPRTNLCR